MAEIIYKDESYRIIGACFNVYNEVGFGLAEALYQECRKNFNAFLADRKEGQPFYYSFHPTNPHRSWTKGSGKALWGLDPDKLQGKMPEYMHVVTPKDDATEESYRIDDYAAYFRLLERGVGTFIKKPGET